ncbi:LOW QUALITY PROTEIN: probable splicing factor YJU2B [Vidua macroura]|uniref:LOW QUALITY PROTEIN: probable splicing factor YJU2B n=1 Tax=Vidua macroura TaxID=187451 RepID=UPI0023A83EF9|nr:LOW QUALITY PROTEIN: probable splicing factor YJU2B [Vidua macroura]
MGERKGTNKYYPPDFDPAKHGSLNKYHRSHPLRERARKLSQGILVIRFEMPFNIWCDGCQNHIGMGVRYNAEKKKVGTYYTTPVYRFRMKCHLCVNYIELQTDPGNCDYVIVSGARRKEERWEPGDSGQVLPTTPEQRERLAMDAMFRLEHGVSDRGVLERATPALARLQQAQHAWKDDFGLNSRLRRRFREEKKTLKEEEEEAAALRAKAGLSIPLLREEEEDRRLAALLTLRAPDSYEEKQRLKRSEISQRSWFSPRAAGGALQKLGLGSPRAPRAPPGPPATPAGLGIVRRKAAEEGGAAGVTGDPRNWSGPARCRPSGPPRCRPPGWGGSPGPPRCRRPPPPHPSSPTIRTPVPRAPERGLGAPGPPKTGGGGADLGGGGS